MVSCQFCKKKFAYKGTLSTHQKTAKYCLEIQGKDISNLFGCEFCNKNFTTQQNLKDHILVCKEKEKIEEEQKQHNKRLLLLPQMQSLLQSLELNNNNKSNQQQPRQQTVDGEKVYLEVVHVSRLFLQKGLSTQ